MLNGGENVVHQQLQAALPLIFVHIEAVYELDGAFRGDKGLRLLDVIERDGIEGSARFWNFDPHFQVPLAHDTGIADGEHTIETRLWKCLAPRPPGA
jgi:hypothetical protein